MRLKLKVSLLLLVLSLTLFSVLGAARSPQAPWHRWLPVEVYENLSRKAGRAEYFLGQSGGYVAVFQGRNDTQPLSITGIELGSLRLADRAMLQKGIPVSDDAALLQLLEDLGS